MKKTITLCFLLFAFLVKAQTTLNLKFFIEGYYIGGGMMRTGDTATVELDSSNFAYTTVATFKGPFLANGTMTCTFGSAIAGHSYYIVVKTRNAIQTWSAAPVPFTATTNYDFTTASNRAYGDEMDSLAPGVWAFWSGDINQDENIDLIDYPILCLGINQGLCGYYASDLNGDGNVDLIDFAILERSICMGVFSFHP